MDVMDYVPYSGFVQNDEETIAIMTKAATIVPKVCDILGISLSDSESEDEDENDADDDTTDVPEERSPGQPRAESPTVQPKPKLRPADWSSLDADTVGASPESGDFVRHGNSSNAPATATTTCEGPKTTTAQTRIKRKRCASTPSSLGQSTSTNRNAEDVSETSARAAGMTQIGLNPPKRRRFPSISLPPTSAISQSNNMSEEEVNIRRKMHEDLEVFNNQIRQLAMIEKTKNRLLEKMLYISSALKNQGRTTPTATPATNSQDNQ